MDGEAALTRRACSIIASSAVHWLRFGVSQMASAFWASKEMMPNLAALAVSVHPDLLLVCMIVDWFSCHVGGNGGASGGYGGTVRPGSEISCTTGEAGRACCCWRRRRCCWPRTLSSVLKLPRVAERLAPMNVLSTHIMPGPPANCSCIDRSTPPAGTVAMMRCHVLLATALAKVSFRTQVPTVWKPACSCNTTTNNQRHECLAEWQRKLKKGSVSRGRSPSDLRPSAR